jgi:DMSO/TMAO reductase YedYZ molybdopterin-dependent catalytic subunit
MQTKVLQTWIILNFLFPALALAVEVDDVVLKVTGEVEQPLSLKRADLRSMPRLTLKAREKNQEEITFEGVALAEIIKRSKPRLSEKCCDNAANTCVIIYAADKFRAVFSLPEIDASFSDHKILLADQRDGKSLADSQGPLKLIVPDEKIHDRWVRQVKTIEIVRVTPSTKP